MRNLRMTVAYDGSHYVGWQIQPNGPSVQAVMQQAIHKLTGQDINLLAAGRTDSGVHALGQVISFQIESPIPADAFRKAMVRFLPPDITVRDVTEVPADFHATFSTKWKQYRYVIHTSSHRNPFLRDYVWHRHGPLDVAAMHAAAQVLVGRHDFRSFESHWPNKSSSVRTVYELTVRRQAFCPLWFGDSDVGPSVENTGDFVWLEIAGNGFLYNMVRAITGTLLPVGMGRRTVADVRAILQARDRSQGGDTAPATGLYLAHVEYETDWPGRSRP